MILFALSLSLITQAQDALTDPALDKPISIDLKMASLSQVATELTRLTGIKVTVGGKIADRKVVIVADKRPAREVMERLATALFCEWSGSGRQSRMDLPRDVGRDEASLVEAEAAVTKDLLAKTLKQLAALSVQKDIDISREEERSRVALAQARSRNQPADVIADIEARHSALETLAAGGLFKYVSMSLNQFGDPEYSTLMSGHTAFSAYPPTRGIAELPKEAVPDAITVKVDANTTVFAAGAVAMFRYRPDKRSIEVKVQVTGLPNASGSTGGDLVTVDPIDLRNLVDSSALGKRLKAWAVTNDPEVLTEPLAFDAEVPKPGYTMHALSAADQLEWVSKKSGVPVVADAFRLPCSREQVFAAKDIADWLQRFNVERDDAFKFLPGLVRTEGGWLLWRQDHYWDHLSSETPESILQAIEQVSSSRPLTLDDYGNFAAALTPTQAESYRGLFKFRVLVKFKAAPLRTNMAPLRLYGSLSESQRQEVLGKAIAFVNLTSAQQQAYMETLEAALWDTHVPELLLPAFYPGSGATLGSMGLTIEAHPDAGTGVSAYLNEALPPDAVIGASTTRTAGYRFLLGSSAQNAVTYEVGVAVK